MPFSQKLSQLLQNLSNKNNQVAREPDIAKSALLIKAALQRINKELSQDKYQPGVKFLLQENNSGPIVINGNTLEEIYYDLYQHTVDEEDDDLFIATISEEGAVTIWVLTQQGLYKSYLDLLKINLRIYAKFLPLFSAEPQIYLDFQTPTSLNTRTIREFMSPEEYQHIFVLQDIDGE